MSGLPTSGHGLANSYIARAIAALPDPLSYLPGLWPKVTLSDAKWKGKLISEMSDAELDAMHAEMNPPPPPAASLGFSRACREIDKKGYDLYPSSYDVRDQRGRDLEAIPDLMAKGKYVEAHTLACKWRDMDAKAIVREKL